MSMTRCDKCNIHVEDRPLYRINQTGITGIFRCMPCIEQDQQLAGKVKKAMSPVETDLSEILYRK